MFCDDELGLDVAIKVVRVETDVGDHECPPRIDRRAAGTAKKRRQNHRPGSGAPETWSKRGRDHSSTIDLRSTCHNLLRRPQFAGQTLAWRRGAIDTRTHPCVPLATVVHAT